MHLSGLFIPNSRWPADPICSAASRLGFQFNIALCCPYLPFLSFSSYSRSLLNLTLNFLVFPILSILQSSISQKRNSHLQIDSCFVYHSLGHRPLPTLSLVLSFPSWIWLASSIPAATSLFQGTLLSTILSFPWTLKYRLPFM